MTRRPRTRSAAAKDASPTTVASAGTAADLYLAACDETRAKPDPAVLAALQTKYTALTLSPRMSGPGCLLPLLAALPSAPHVTAIRVVPDDCCQAHRNHGSSGDVDAWVLAKLLRACPHVTELFLEGCHFSVPALHELCAAVGESEVLAKLTIRSCRLGNEGCVVLAEALRGNVSVVELDASYNWLGGRATAELKAALLSGAADAGAGVVYEARGNAWFQEIWNSVTHGAGTFLAVTGSIVLLHHACGDTQSTGTFWACLIYCASLITLYTASTLYHAFFMLEGASSVFMVLDHSAIYMLIAGSYTPFCLITLQGQESGVVVAVLEWTLALFGILFGAVCAYLKIGPLSQMLVELTLYLTMGWAALGVWDGLEANMSARGLELLILGGTMYSGGVVFFLAEKFHPASHTVWHCFVMVGSIIHYFVILFHVVGLREDGGGGIPTIVVHPSDLVKWLQEMQRAQPASIGMSH